MVVICGDDVVDERPVGVGWMDLARFSLTRRRRRLGGLLEQISKLLKDPFDGWRRREL